jgi:hypothetical protein
MGFEGVKTFSINKMSLQILTCHSSPAGVRPIQTQTWVVPANAGGGDVMEMRSGDVMETRDGSRRMEKMGDKGIDNRAR